MRSMTPSCLARRPFCRPACKHAPARLPGHDAWPTPAFSRPQTCMISSRKRRIAGSAIPVPLQPELVKPVFSTFNFLLLPPWVLMVAAPRAGFTKALIKSQLPMLIYSLLFVYFFVAATAQSVSQGNDIGSQIVFLFTEATADPRKMVEMFDSGSYAAQDWAHLCAWDYFVGQWIYQQGLEKNVPTGISLLLTFNSGPFGLLLHWATEKVTLFRRRKSEEEERAQADDTPF